MLNNSQKLGNSGEKHALQELKKAGYKIIETNFRTKSGEIDIIGRENDYIVFIEVKTRRTNSFGNAKYSVNHKKQKKICKAALYYLKSTNNINSKARFDVVLVSVINNEKKINIIKNAFGLVQ